MGPFVSLYNILKIGSMIELKKLLVYSLLAKSVVGPIT